jgi:TonB family protein
MVTLLLTIFILIVSCGTVYPQTEFATNKGDSILFCIKCDSVYNKICPPNIFGHPQELSKFLGGERGMMKFIAENLKYPAKCKEDSIRGRVIVRFIIDESGKVICPRIIKSRHPKADEEALRVIKIMPDWKPASNNGIPCKMCFTLPITFKPPPARHSVQKN